MILFHITSSIEYDKSTPVISDINTSHKKMQYSLAYSIKRSLLITQQKLTAFRLADWFREYIYEKNAVTIKPSNKMTLFEVGC